MRGSFFKGSVSIEGELKHGLYLRANRAVVLRVSLDSEVQSSHLVFVLEQRENSETGNSCRLLRNIFEVNGDTDTRLQNSWLSEMLSQSDAQVS